VLRHFGIRVTNAGGWGNERRHRPAAAGFGDAKMSKEKILLLLSEFKMTTSELCCEVKLEESTVRYHIAKLRETKKVRISGWEKSGRQTVPIYAAGNGNDAKKPDPQHRITIRLRYNEKHRAKVRLTQRKGKVTPWDVLGLKNINWGVAQQIETEN